MPKQLAKRWSGENDDGILRRVEKKLAKEPPLKEQITRAIHLINFHVKRLDQVIAKLRKRDQEIFNKCIDSEMRKDRARAVIYAIECAENRKILRSVMASKLALEKIALRLETMHDLGEIVVALGPSIKLVKSLKNQLSSLTPEIAMGMEEINLALNSLMDVIHLPSDALPDFDSASLSQEVQQILNEAYAVAEQRMAEKFPEIPSNLLSSSDEMDQLRIPVSVTVDGSSEDVKELVYRYVKEHGGNVNLAKCAADLQLSPELVREVIEALEKEGRIVVID